MNVSIPLHNATKSGQLDRIAAVPDEEILTFLSHSGHLPTDISATLNYIRLERGISQGGVSPGPSPFPNPGPNPNPGPFPSPFPNPIPGGDPIPIPLPFPQPDPGPQPGPIPSPNPGPIASRPLTKVRALMKAGRPFLSWLKDLCGKAAGEAMAKGAGARAAFWVACALVLDYVISRADQEVVDPASLESWSWSVNDAEGSQGQYAALTQNMPVNVQGPDGSIIPTVVVVNYGLTPNDGQEWAAHQSYGQFLAQIQPAFTDVTSHEMDDDVEVALATALAKAQAEKVTGGTGGGGLSSASGGIPQQTGGGGGSGGFNGAFNSAEGPVSASGNSDYGVGL